MSSKRAENRKAGVKPMSFDDLQNEKQKGMMMSILEQNPKAVTFVVFIFLWQIISNILTWLMAFNII
jgi:hypothetical protein